MAVKVSVQNVLAIRGGQGAFLVSGVLVLTGNYVSGGDAVDFTAAVADPALVGGAGPFIDSSLAVENFDVWSQGGNITNPYFAVIGTTQKNCKLKVVTAFNTELGNGVAYSAAILSDNIGFMAIFSNLL